MPRVQSSKKKATKKPKPPPEIVEAKKEVQALSKRIGPVLSVPWSRAKAPSLKPIEKESQYIVLAKSIKDLRVLQKEIKSRLKERTDPLKKVIKLIKEDYDPMISDITEYITDRQDLCDEWDQKKRLEAMKAAEKEAKKAEKAGANGFAADLRVHASTAQVTPRVEGVKERYQKTYEVVDIDKVPREYLQLDRGKVWKAVQDGVEIPGIEMSERKIVF